MVGGRILNTLAKALVNPRSMRKQKTRVRLRNILQEDSGDYSGEPSFQGGPLGFGGRQQLANPVTPPGLQDPAEKKYYPVIPSLYPVLFAQEEDPVSQLDEAETQNKSGKKLLLLVHPDIVFEMSTNNMQIYLKKIEDEVLRFDYVITHLFYSPEFKPEWLSRDPTHNHIFQNFIRMIQRNSNLVKWDNPRFMASFRHELPYYLIDNPGTTIYLAGGYKDLCVKATQEMMNDKLGTIIRETDTSVVCYQPLMIQNRDSELGSLSEYARARGDILYKDLPGGPRMNTLDNPRDHVPHGEDPYNKLDSNPYGNVNHLLPTGRDDIDPGDQFMVDDLDDSSVDGLNLDKSNIMASPNQWDVTSPEYRGKLLNPPSSVFDQLVKPVDWIGMETGNNDHPYMPGEINDQDFESRVMQAGNIVKPVIWVGNGDDRNNNNMDKPYLKPDYYIGEAMATSINKNEDKQQSSSIIKPKPTGNGIGTVQSRFDKFPTKGKSDKTEPFGDKTEKAPVPNTTTNSNLSSVANDTSNTSWNIANLSDDQATVLQEKIVKLVMEKLVKLHQLSQHR